MLVYFFTDVSLTVSIQELGSDSSGSIWGGGISPPFSTHQLKDVPLVYARYLDRSDR